MFRIIIVIISVINLLININAFKLNIIKEFDLFDETYDYDTNFIRLHEKYEKTFETIKLFKTKIVESFAIELVFRFDNTFNRIFHIFGILDENGKSQILISSDHRRGIIFTILISGLFQRHIITIDDLSIFDDKWHKLIVTYHKGKVKIWLDCLLVKNVNNFPGTLYFTDKTHLHLAYNNENFGEFDLLKVNLYFAKTRPLEDFCQDIPSAIPYRAWHDLLSHWENQELI